MEWQKLLQEATSYKVSIIYMHVNVAASALVAHYQIPAEDNLGSPIPRSVQVSFTYDHVTTQCDCRGDEKQGENDGSHAKGNQRTTVLGCGHALAAWNSLLKESNEVPQLLDNDLRYLLASFGRHVPLSSGSQSSLTSATRFSLTPELITKTVALYDQLKKDSFCGITAFLVGRSLYLRFLQDDGASLRLYVDGEITWFECNCQQQKQEDTTELLKLGYGQRKERLECGKGAFIKRSGREEKKKRG
jgi:hypothetical protein